MRRTLLTLCLMVLGACAVAQPSPEERIRGIWLNRHLMAEGEEAIVAFLDQCESRGITHVLPNFWFHGYLIYPGSDLAPQHPDFEGWDPMAVVVREAHARGLRVWPWSEYGFFTHFNRTMDEAGCGRILTEHPEWRMADSEGHIGLRNEGIGVIHFSMNPAHPEARTFLIGLHLDIAERYEIDGINTDRIRYMGPDWGHDPYSLARFEEDERIDRAAPDAFDRWRVLQINDFQRELAERWRAAHSDLPITAAVNPPYMFEDKFQHFGEWMAEGTLDVAVPMIYGGPGLVRRECEAMAALVPEGGAWLAGLDAAQGDETLSELVSIAEAAGAAGVVIWSDTAWREREFTFETLP
jgi:uncharacterized lipoprotein YddW (UPF0748 family)